MCQAGVAREGDREGKRGLIRLAEKTKTYLIHEGALHRGAPLRTA